MRKISNLNQGWKFIKDDDEAAIQAAFENGNGESVDLPHTWNAIDGANGFEYFKGACWYRKEFTISSREQGNAIFIEFHGSNSITDVYVNTVHVGQHKGGYSIFRFDITDAVEFGKTNLLAVKVDNALYDDVYPQMADFTFYGGIYRDVNLVIANPVHFDLLDYGSQGVYVVQDDVTNERASLSVKTKITNDRDEEKKVRLWVDLLDPRGESVAYAAQEVFLAAGETKEVVVPAVIEHPVLWNGRKHAYLYQAKVSITSFNDTIDEVSIPFGVRYFKVDPEQGFFLNGEHLPLHGVSRHQDRKDMGWAITKREHQEDMELIKEVGATSIRLAHYQHDQYFYDLCDQEGMVIWAEIPFISVMSKTELEGVNAKQQMIELIRQNFNHPSIMFWGVQNEIQIGGDRPEVRRLVQQLHELTKKEDPTRLTTMANVSFVEMDDAYNYITDVVGYNHYFGWYGGKPEDFESWLDRYHELNPNAKLGISEYGVEGILQYHSSDPKVKDYTEEYHALLHEKVWNIFAKRPYLWGTYVWNMFDFGANIRDEGGVKGRNNKGLVTYDRKIKKDAFYLYKAHWSDRKFVHIAGKRFIDRPDADMNVKIYSNCDEVTLYVNGKEVAAKTGDHHIFMFENVRLQDGWNEIKAVSQQDGEIHVDVARWSKSDEPNLSYTAPESKGGVVSNWFKVPEDAHDDIQMEELEITPDVYSTRDTIGALMDNEQANAVLKRFMGDLSENPMFDMLKSLKIDMLASLSDDLSDQFLYRLNKELTQIKK
ncbi:glycoside hydrolase family 2 protein [Paenibacillus chibensis]|uniref:glycoside hydrolase family 2 protein n=1 Tax=Paenibacillus chibensis TaxID=59846 RepID=UPI000FDB5EEF|nr:glycoside hydrolase family 2 TIM barrel-domain containing protein [Paenibacillus chibensis]MEC0370101.1 glycoside hydrolase family 2 TIM barrel-domain containing protein [Paenibacillus chibensis]